VFPHLWTVTELTSHIRLQLERTFPFIWIQGEVSNVRCPSSGHRYFTLKDQSSQIRAVLFRPQADRLPFCLADGLSVIAGGRLSVYESRGDYQLLLDVLEPKGLGARQLAFLQLKERLEREGLFEQGRKKPLPLYPQKVGLVTSASGAAIHDLMTVIHRRWPPTQVLLVPVTVQGSEAPRELKEAIQLLNDLEDVDVMVVGRGGGASEDLWAFNQEEVVRAIAGSRIPVISAVGHETDVTLADFAADYRAPTPSAAAELVVPDWKAVSHRMEQYRLRLVRLIKGIMDRATLEVRELERQLPEPRLMIGRYSQRIDDLEGKLVYSLIHWQRSLRIRWHDFQAGIWARNPQIVIVRRRDQLEAFHQAIYGLMKMCVRDRRHVIHALGVQLHHLSPLGVLGRGYGIVRRMRDDKVLKESREVLPGEIVHVRLSRGNLICVVNESRT
jgi:exodeoxyribonuclease VII large subunit